MIKIGSIVVCKKYSNVRPIIGNTHIVIGFSHTGSVLITNIKNGHDGFVGERPLYDENRDILNVDLRDGRQDLYYVIISDLKLYKNDSIRLDKLIILTQYNDKSG